MTVGRSTSPTHIIGAAAEELACQFLQAQGCTLIAQNVHTAYGEIDLIMQQGQTLLFVEVRARKNEHFGGAAGSVTRAKMRKIWQTADFWLHNVADSAFLEFDIRFDVVTVQMPNRIHSTPRLNWIKAAFDGNDLS